MRKFGLIGKNISYSFSQTYFKNKFENEHIINATYENFDLQSIDEFKALITTNPHLAGLNVTIPYKETVIPFLDIINKKAKKIGAVNTIKFTKKGKLKGYNTDCYGFEKSLIPLLKQHHENALILGTGGASKAVAFVLKKLDIGFKFVSRSKQNNSLIYDELNADIIKTHQIIINCTPLGTQPKINEFPSLPYQNITRQHLLYDLIYNPSKTSFLEQGEQQGAIICNGQKMLELQAEKAWKIWNK